MLLRSTRVKAAQKTLMKLTLGRQNLISAAFPSIFRGLYTQLPSESMEKCLYSAPLLSAVMFSGYFEYAAPANNE